MGDTLTAMESTATLDQTTPTTLSAFIVAHGLTMSAERVSHNPNMADAMPGASHWDCRLMRPERFAMNVTFSMGSAHVGAPEIAHVLDCLASDASGVENTKGFEEWADEYGYDPDSRKAFATFQACTAQANNLSSFLGEAYETLLWHVERE